MTLYEYKTKLDFYNRWLERYTKIARKLGAPLILGFTPVSEKPIIGLNEKAQRAQNTLCRLHYELQMHKLSKDENLL
jgi:hypothetical protein